MTVFDSFKKDASTWDVAVVTLAKPLGSLTGYMGVASGCARNLQLSTAGYPQDKSRARAWRPRAASPRSSATRPRTRTAATRQSGMSGAPLWDAKNRVRLIHVAGGVEGGGGGNRATTLTQFLVNTVKQW